MASLHARLAFLPAEAARLLLVSLYETAWVTGWILLIGEIPGFATHRPLLPGAAVFGLLAVVSLTTCWTLRAERPLWQSRLLTLGVVLCAVLVCLLAVYSTSLAQIGQRQGLAVAFAASTVICLALAWRGLVLGRSRLNYDHVHQSFLIGLIAVLVLLVAATTLGRGALVAGLAPGLLLFFAAGLISLALARVHDVQEEARVQRGLALPLQRRWLLLLIGLVGAMLLVALTLSAVVSLSALAAVLGPLLRALGWAADGILFIIFLPLGYLVAFVIYALRWLLSLLGLTHPPPPPTPDQVTQELRKPQNGHAHPIPPEALLALKISLLAVVALCAVLLLARAVFRYWRRPEQEGAIELHESVFDAAEFWAGLRALLHRFLERLWARSKPPVAARPAPDASFEASPIGVRSVRAIYRQLVTVMAQRGWPRAPAETPYEYLGDLTEQVPEGRAELEAITEAYVQVRYGERSVSETELRRVHASWQAFSGRLAQENPYGRNDDSQR